MIPIFSILLVTTLLAYFWERKSVVIRHDRNGVPFRIKRRRINRYAFYAIQAILILFVGLRTSFNDTAAYIKGFELLDTGLEGIAEMNWALGDNPGFHLSNLLLKTFASENAQVMLFLYALITIVLFYLFYRRWSSTFWLTVFLFITCGMLLFSMAAMKQVLAMGIGLYGITCFLKKRRIAFVVCVLIGSTVHTYLLLYLGAFFLDDRLWSRKVLFVVGGSVLCGVFIDQFIQIAYKTTEFLGADYAAYDELSGVGLNIARFLIYSVTPALTWIYRKRINASGDRALILFSNFTLIGWCFMFIALFVSANMFARMAMYFDPFMHVALTTLVVRYTPRKNRRLVLAGCLLGYLAYFAFELYGRGFVYQWIFS